MRKLRVAPGLLALVVAAAPGAAVAEADGPDHWAVRGVRAGSVLNLRAEPTVAAARLGTIPADGTGLRNLGCTGGPTLAEWERMSEAERAAAALRRWCRVEYRGAEGWVAGRYLVEWVP